MPESVCDLQLELSLRSDRQGSSPGVELTGLTISSRDSHDTSELRLHSSWLRFFRCTADLCLSHEALLPGLWGKSVLVNSCLGVRRGLAFGVVPCDRLGLFSMLFGFFCRVTFGIQVRISVGRAPCGDGKHVTTSNHLHQCP